MNVIRECYECYECYFKKYSCILMKLFTKFYRKKKKKKKKKVISEG